MTAAPLRLAIDARFRAQPSATGVHRWAGAVLAALPALGVGPVELVPARGSGPVGHAWEQLVLPGRVRGVRSDLPLLSPCNWGPLAVRDQAVVVHDVSPMIHPEHFSPAYVELTRRVLPVLARRVRTVLTVSETSRRDIVERLPVDPAAVVVVGAGSTALPPPDTRVTAGLRGPWFAFVGGHDERKNVRFLLDLWPEVHARTGATLVVTRRDHGRTLTGRPVADLPWCTELVDPTDAELAAVLAGARRLLWPSSYEGFGLPLLEAYGLGTGFVAADTGVARELAVPGDEVLPLDRDAWVTAAVAAVEHDDAPAARERRRAVAAAWTWDDVAGRVLAALQR